MLGFSPTGSVPLGGLPLTIDANDIPSLGDYGVLWAVNVPGAGRRLDVTPFVPSPPLGVRPNKPFRPIWDRGPRQIEAIAPAIPVGPLPAPPKHIFVRAADKAPKLDAFKLQSFDHLVPQDLAGLGTRMRDAMDRSDLMDLSDAISALDALLASVDDEDKAG